MYALVILLTGLGFLALHRAVAAPRPGNLIAVAVVTAALLYSQYWSVYLVGMVGLWLVASIWRSRHRGRPTGRAVGRPDRSRRREPALRALGADLLLPGQAHGHAVGGRRRTSRP